MCNAYNVYNYKCFVLSVMVFVNYILLRLLELFLLEFYFAILLQTRMKKEFKLFI